jgi:hypothetical protein
MRCSASSCLVPLAFALFTATLVHGFVPRDDGQFTGGALLARDDHHHAGAPLLVLNETEISMWYGTTLDSYYTIDWEGAGEPGARYPALIMTHIILMCLAFFVFLPISKLLALLPPRVLIGVSGIAMRSVRHAAHGFVVAVFYVLVALGCITSSLYSKLTPTM